MMRKPIVTAVLGALLLFLAVAAGRAQKLESLPGYVPIEELNLFPPDKLSVEVNLDGPLLHMVAAATKGDDPEFSAVMAGLKSIKVQVYPLKGVDAGAVKGKIGRAVHWLEGHGWQSSIRVKEKGDETYIYLKQTGDRIEGLTLLSLNPGDEAVIINIVGRIDPAEIGRLGKNLDLPQLQKIPARGGGARKPE
ncbi:MAG TPA: DUF4252 domain-containing protein [Thermoanaerobaculia bacterium]|jgi:hypothetical protein